MENERQSNGETTLSINGKVPVPAECKFTLHTFSDTFLDQKVHFQILKMTDSLYVWIGTSPEMDALAVAMCTKYVSGNHQTSQMYEMHCYFQCMLEIKGQVGEGGKE